VPTHPHPLGLKARVVLPSLAAAAASIAIVFATTAGSAVADRERALAAAALCGALAALAAGRAVERHVLRRVKAMLATTRKLRGGDLAARTGPDHGSAELGALACEVDGVAAALQQQQQDRVRAEERARLGEARTSAVLDASFDGVFVLDGLGAVLECNAAARALFGCDGRRCVHHRLSDLFPGELPFDSTRFNRPAEAFETTGRRLDRSEFPAEMSIAPIRDRAAHGLFVAAVRDVSARRQLERSLEGLSLRDELTGAYNRRGFLMFATQQLKLAARNGQAVLLLSADLDGLGAINEHFGRANGDRALIELSRALAASFSDTDVIGRLGGDEFVVLATESERGGPEQALERFTMRISNRNAEGDLPWTLGASMGWLRTEPAQGATLGELLARVDERMIAHPRRTPGPAHAWLPSLEPEPPRARMAGEPRPDPRSAPDPLPGRAAAETHRVA
jgi:diguanylate cyclase (GGDEF)-like protein/PAS domain S-box-containing protein